MDEMNGPSLRQSPAIGQLAAALAKAHASQGAARGVIGDELRRAAIESGFRVGGPSGEEISEYYETYGATRARLVVTKTSAPWLGNRKRGFALESNAPPQVFSLPQGGGWHSISTMRGAFQVRALDAPVSLGALPLNVARPAVVAALQGLARSDRY